MPLYMTRPISANSIEHHMTIKQLLLSFFIIIGTLQIGDAQQWVYNSSGTEIKGSYRYASLTSGANDNPRSSSIYINYYDLDQKYNIYLYEITGLECSDNTIQYFTDSDKTPQTFSVKSKSDGIETIAMTEIEDLTAFLSSVKNASHLTLSIKNTCGTGRDILFPMENAAEAIAFMTPSQEQVQEQASSSSIKSEQSNAMDNGKMEQMDSSSQEVLEQAQMPSSKQVQEQASSSSIKGELSDVMDSGEMEQMDSSPQEVIEQVQVPSSTEVQEQVSSSSIKGQASTDAEWARLTKRNKELDKKDSLLVVFQAQLDERELALIIKEQQIEAKARQAQSAPAVVSAPVETTTPAPTPIASTVVTSTSYPYRYVQFVATTAGRSYDQLSYIGQIISEQIPGRNITRYKVMGQWSDADIARVKNQLAQEGFQGAFESK